MNSIGGFKPSPYGLYETAATLNDTWGFSYHDHNWKTPEFIRSTREKLNSMGINYLINVGPDPLGRITADAQRSKVKKFLAQSPASCIQLLPGSRAVCIFQRMGE